MIVSDYYQNYSGPNLIKATMIQSLPLNQTKEIDITEQIKEKYGPKNNWNGCLWTYKELFGFDSYGYNFRVEFKSEDGRDHWFHGFIHDVNQYFNPPLATPMDQKKG